MNHPPLHYEPLQNSHLDELAMVLRHPVVYAHIEDAVPGLEDFKRGLTNAIAGPPSHRSDEQWLNFLVRESSGAMVGRLEATVHHELAEVAFLFGPQYWGRGWAGMALRWLHMELARKLCVRNFWATTTLANVRSRRVLERCGYVLVSSCPEPLYSYEPGDLVYHRCCEVET